jgi:[acyl-carrier-protein] S-malonyltransferase
LTIALFPGQGVQAPGMDGGLAASSTDVFTTASEVLGVDVAELCREGSTRGADLSTTRWAQPAVLTCSVAWFRALEQREPFVAVAGHSIGEYAALVAGRSVDLADAVRLVALRAESTQAAAEAIPGGMAAVMRLDRRRLEEICAETNTSLAADNSVGQLVISGPLSDLARARELASAAGAVCRALEVDGAFHSPIMAAAAEPMKRAIDETPISSPEKELWSPTTAAPVSDPDEIKAVLVEQLTSPVLWRETVEGLAERHGGAFVDIGPGRVVGGLAKRIVGGADVRFAADLVPIGGSS